MPRYTSWYKTAYRDTEYFWGSHSISSEYTKNTEFYPNQNLYKYISTSYLTFSPQKSLKFSLTKMPELTSSVKCFSKDSLKQVNQTQYHAHWLSRLAHFLLVTNIWNHMISLICHYLLCDTDHFICDVFLTSRWFPVTIKPRSNVSVSGIRVNGTSWTQSRQSLECWHSPFTGSQSAIPGLKASMQSTVSCTMLESWDYSPSVKSSDRRWLWSERWYVLSCSVQPMSTL